MKTALLACEKCVADNLSTTPPKTGGGGPAFFEEDWAGVVGKCVYPDAKETINEAIALLNPACNCVVGQCSDILTILDQIKAANESKQKTLTITKPASVENNHLENEGGVAQLTTGIELFSDSKMCFKISLDFNFTETIGKINPSIYDEIDGGIEFFEDEKKTKKIMTLKILGSSDTPEKYYKISLLKVYLGLSSVSPNKNGTKRVNKMKNLLIKIASGVPEDVISTDIENLLYEILDNAEIDRTMTITSTFRSADGQAKAMISLIKSDGVDAVKALYGSKGDKVINYYVKLKDTYSDAEIVALLVVKMVEVGFVSAHMDWLTKGAVDFGETTNGFDGKYSNEIQPIVVQAKKQKKVNSSQVFPPTSEGEHALHIEIKLK